MALQAFQFVDVVSHVAHAGHAARNIQQSIQRLRMHVHVKQTRQQRFTAPIDALGIFRNLDRGGRSGLRDALALDDYRLIFPHGGLFRIKYANMLYGHRMFRVLRQLFRQPLVAGLVGLSLQFIQLLVFALPPFPQDREPLPRRPKQAVLVIEPDGLGFEGKSGDRKRGYMQLLLVILERRVRHSLQPRLTRRQEFHRTALRLHQRGHQQCELCPRSVVADVKPLRWAGSVLRRALPVRPPLLEGKMFVDRRFQIIVAGNIGAKWQAARSEEVRRGNLWTAAAVIELESAVDSAVHTEFVYFSSSNGVIRHDLVAKCFLRGGRPTQNRSSRANEKKNCYAVYVHRPCILSPIHPSGQAFDSHTLNSFLPVARSDPSAWLPFQIFWPFG